MRRFAAASLGAIFCFVGPATAADDDAPKPTEHRARQIGGWNVLVGVRLENTPLGTRAPRLERKSAIFSHLSTCSREVNGQSTT